VNMVYKIRTRDEHFSNDGTPKRILALDGGGLRGIVTLAFLAEIESMLRARHGGAESFRLSHYFDLIAGTSTGSIIAAALARGHSLIDASEPHSDNGHRGRCQFSDFASAFGGIADVTGPAAGPTQSRMTLHVICRAPPAM